MREVSVAQVSEMTDDQVRCHFVTVGKHNWQFGETIRGAPCFEFFAGYISRTDKCLSCDLTRTMKEGL